MTATIRLSERRLTDAAAPDYSPAVTAKSVIGIGVPQPHRPHRPQNVVRGFFVRVVQHPSYGRLDGGLFGGAGSLCGRYANAVQSPALIGVWVGGSDLTHRSHTMAASARPQLYPDTPEAFFCQPPNMEPDLPVDAINCQLGRTAATVALLMCQFDGTCESRLSDTHIVNALWGVQADLERLYEMVKFGQQSTHAALKASERRSAN